MGISTAPARYAPQIFLERQSRLLRLYVMRRVAMLEECRFE